MSLDGSTCGQLEIVWDTASTKCACKEEWVTIRKERRKEEIDFKIAVLSRVNLSNCHLK